MIKLKTFLQLASNLFIPLLESLDLGPGLFSFGGMVSGMIQTDISDLQFTP